MKVAFVGKGGSGKSTVSALFIKHLIAQGQRVLAIDADINQHLAGMLGAELRPELACTTMQPWRYHSSIQRASVTIIALKVSRYLLPIRLAKQSAMS